MPETIRSSASPEELAAEGAPKSRAGLWHTNEKDLLVQILVEDFNLAHISDNGFKDITWNRIRGALEKLDLPSIHMICAIKSQASKMKSSMLDVKYLRSKSGFSFDTETHLVTAADAVWVPLLTVYPKYRQYRTTLFPYYDDLSMVYNGCTATGRDTIAVGSQQAQTQPELFQDRSQSTPPQGFLHVSPRSSPGPEPTTPPPASRDVSASITQASRKRNRGAAPSGQESMSSLAASLSSISAAYEARTNTSQGTSQDKPYYDLSSPARKSKAWQCFSQQEVDLDDEQIVTARQLFCKTQLADEYMNFLPTQCSARDKWLQDKLEEAKEEKRRHLN